MNAQRDRMKRGATPSKADSRTFSHPPVIGLCHRDGFSWTTWVAQGLPLDVAKTIDRLRLEVFQTGQPLVEEISVEDDAPDGRDSVYECVLAPVPGVGHVIDAIMVTVRDITEARLAEELVRESERRYRLLAENATDMISLHDPFGVYLYASPATKSLLGYDPSELVGHSAYEFMHADDLAQVGRTHATLLDTPDLYTIIFRYRKKNGDYLWVETTSRAVRDDATGQVVEIQCSSRDITRRHNAEELLKLQNFRLEEVARSERQAHESLKQAEVQLVQSEKLAALGQMVAGVAHEINNPLAFVNNNIAVLQRDIQALRSLIHLYQESHPILEEKSPGLLGKIEELADDVDLTYILENLENLIMRSREGLRRIQQIVKDLREFARLDDGDLQAADINAGVQSTITMIREQARQNDVQITANLGEIPLVTCYPGKINQMIMNLLTNAIDACGDREEGEVVVSTEPCPEGDAILLRVKDNGTGIDPRIRGRIFDPFFTTKPIGQGTGLGLSITYGIVKAQGGTIRVDSEPGNGSRFTVRLPLAPQAAIPIRL